jgi:uncharacterized cupin superfamily protein
MSEPFIVNVSDSPAFAHPRAGTTARFDNPADRFPDFGINIQVLEPGQPNALYHSESVQESFLVLGGTPKVILDDEVHQLRPWDFVHCPPGTDHVFVGGGEGPSWILMVGARRPDATITYPRNEVAATHGASAEQATDDPREAYAAWSGEFTEAKLPWPPRA